MSASSRCSAVCSWRASLARALRSRWGRRPAAPVRPELGQLAPLFAALSPWQLVPAIARQTEFVGEKSDIEGTRVGLRRLDWTYIRRELVRFAYDLRLLPMQFIALRRGAKFVAMRAD